MQQFSTLMNKNFVWVTVLLIFTLTTSGQEKYRSGIFLHHSTGDCIWGPNGSSTSVPEQINLYNITHDFAGEDAVSLNETWYPVSNDNEWSIWHTIFEANQPEAISGIFGNNKIVVVKSCFPSSEIVSVGTPGDTMNPTYKSICNYKWHWRHIIRVMENHPDNFFVIWTNAPLEWYSTNTQQAALSDRFCTWAKDTLAQNLDPVYGVFPPNVYVFDFFHKLADENGFLPAMFAVGPNNSHPNALATELVAPQLVNEVFDAAIIYESGLRIKLKVFLEGPYNGTGMNSLLTNVPGSTGFPLSQPFNTEPWIYPGSESVMKVSPNIVDWILVELRDASEAITASSSTVIHRQACFLLNDGTVAGINNEGEIENMLYCFPSAKINNGLFVVVRHRNHLGIMSAFPLNNTSGLYTYDFTSGPQMAYHKGQVKVGPGIWAMIAGDGNASGFIDEDDKASEWAGDAGFQGYFAGDYNMDAQSDNSDKNENWLPNLGAACQVPE